MVTSRLLGGDFLGDEVTVNFQNYSFLPAHEEKSELTPPDADIARQTKLIISF